MSDRNESEETNETQAEGGSGGVSRRRFLKTAGAAVAAASFPYIWIPNEAIAQTSARGEVKHLLYIRLSGGFRFPAAFNAAVGAEFNPYGEADTSADGTEWGVSSLLHEASWLDGEEGSARSALGMQPVTSITNDMAVIPCVDHEPLAGSAD